MHIALPPRSLISFLAQGYLDSRDSVFPLRFLEQYLTHSRDSASVGWTQSLRGGAFIIKDSGYVAKESQIRIPGSWVQAVAEFLCKMGNNSVSALSGDYKDS